MTTRHVPSVVAVALVASCIAACGRINAELDAGYAYGRDHDLGACYEESLRRLNACTDLACQALAPGFARGCAAKALPSEAFCSQVPDSVMDASDWIQAQCASHPQPKACYKVIQQPASKCL